MGRGHLKGHLGEFLLVVSGSFILGGGVFLFVWGVVLCGFILCYLAWPAGSIVGAIDGWLRGSRGRLL